MAELAPVFAAAASINDTADQIREAARVQARSIITAADDESAALLSTAAVEADRVRERARTRIGLEQAALRRRLLDEAERTAGEMTRSLRAEHDGRVRAALAAVRTLAGGSLG